MRHFLVLAILFLLFVYPLACTKDTSPPTTPSSSGGSSLATDGINWIFASVNAPFLGRDNHTSLVFNDKMWVIGGNVQSIGISSDTWYSTDGAVWNQAANNGSASSFPTRSDHSSVVFNSAMWVIGGWNGSNPLKDTWSSLDGLHWNQGTSGASNSFTARCDHTSVVFNGKMWVIGGDTNPSGAGSDLNDVWSSSNGVTWTQVAANGSPNSFPIRDSHTSLVFNNQMWVIAGVLGATNATTVMNDVWSSSNGVTWTQVLANNSSNSFPSRFLHTSLVFDGAMWVMGGFGNSGPLNDAWYSTDGAHWTQAAIQQDYLPRGAHTSLVFNNAMWILAGFENGAYLSDTWHSP